jgi:hypothetical protein
VESERGSGVVRGIGELTGERSGGEMMRDVDRVWPFYFET